MMELGFFMLFFLGIEEIKFWRYNFFILSFGICFSSALMKTPAKAAMHDLSDDSLIHGACPFLPHGAVPLVSLVCHINCDWKFTSYNPLVGPSANWLENEFGFGNCLLCSFSFCDSEICCPAFESPHLNQVCVLK